MWTSHAAPVALACLEAAISLRSSPLVTLRQERRLSLRRKRPFCETSEPVCMLRGACLFLAIFAIKKDYVQLIFMLSWESGLLTGGNSGV